MAVGSANIRIVLLSGPICSDKSALVRLLTEKHSAKIIKTRELILKKAPKTKPERKSLQRAGQRLDREDGGAWVGEALQRTVDSYATGQTPKGLYVVDSVRILGQIEAIRRAYGAEVHHIHLTATEKEPRISALGPVGSSDQLPKDFLFDP